VGQGKKKKRVVRRKKAVKNEKRKTFNKLNHQEAEGLGKELKSLKNSSDWALVLADGRSSSPTGVKIQGDQEKRGGWTTGKNIFKLFRERASGQKPFWETVLELPKQQKEWGSRKWFPTGSWGKHFCSKRKAGEPTRMYRKGGGGLRGDKKTS